LLVAVVEVAITTGSRCRLLRPSGAAGRAWHTYLDYVGLFSFYFNRPPSPRCCSGCGAGRELRGDHGQRARGAGLIVAIHRGAGRPRRSQIDAPAVLRP